LQLISASAGAWILTELLKMIAARPRPDAVPALVYAVGFSFPSGHALTGTAMYVTLVFLASRYLRVQSQRRILLFATTGIVGAIAFSRVYLGVHYPTDIIAGILMGAGWALLMDSLWATEPQL
jgi:undecaprenyl-diphosphatase